VIVRAGEITIKSVEEMFRHTAIDSSLSVEKATERVPSDGKYYLLDGNDVVGVFATKKTAINRFRELLKQQQYTPPPKEDPDVDPKAEALENYFQAKDLYWGTSHSFASKGGPGR